MKAQNTLNIKKSTLRIGDKILDLRTPKVMGILNLTPDSFYVESRTHISLDLITKAEKMLAEGADILDIGAFSSRPGASDVPEEEECKTIEAACKSVLKHYPNCMLSIDTFRASVAERALNVGAHMINDISGGQGDTHMYSTVAKFKVPYIGMHMRGYVTQMMKDTEYSHLEENLFSYFIELKNKTKEAGILDCIFDPGFGFSKTLDQNFDLLRHFDYLTNLQMPILAGVSRKSMIYKVLESDPEQALNGTTALHMYLLQKGANILRVHDVKEAKEVVRLYQKINT